MQKRQIPCIFSPFFGHSSGSSAPIVGKGVHGGLVSCIACLADAFRLYLLKSNNCREVH